jgi:hypothetical protein
MNIYLWSNNQQTGPYTAESLRESVAAGQLSASQTACLEGETEWQPLSQLLNLAYPEAIIQKPQTKPNIGKKGNDFLARPAVSAKADNGYEIKRRSSWSTFFVFCGSLGGLIFFFGIFVFIASKNENDRALSLTLLLIGALSAVQCLFFSFVIDVFTDIRWFIKKISEK